MVYPKVLVGHNICWYNPIMRSVWILIFSVCLHMVGCETEFTIEGVRTPLGSKVTEIDTTLTGSNTPGVRGYIELANLGQAQQMRVIRFEYSRGWSGLKAEYDLMLEPLGFEEFSGDYGPAYGVAEPVLLTDKAYKHTSKKLIVIIRDNTRFVNHMRGSKSDPQEGPEYKLMMIQLK